MATRRTRSSTAEITPKQEEPSSEEEEDEEEGEEEEDGEEVDEGEEDEEEEGEEEGEEEDEEEEDEEEEEEEDDEEDDEEEDISSKRESIRRLLEPFGKEQLVELLKEAARADSSVLQRISTAADSDTTHRKIFVHGLGWDATSDTLRSAFDQYDDVEECNVVTDRSTGKSKGYGFVLLRTRAGTLRALQEPQKRIGNRLAACQLASTGPIHAQGNATTDPKGRKIFVNNVGPNVDMDKLRKFFTQFGEIEEGPLGYDRATGKLRGFAIFVYKTIEGCRRALEEPTKFFEGSQLHCQRAVEADKIRGGQAAVGALGAALPQNDLNLTASLMGLNPAAAAALLGQNVGSLAGGLAGQGAGGVGGLNPALGGGAAATGLSALANQNAAGLGLGAGSGIGSVNSSIPGVAGNYSSQLGLQGLGVQQSSQIPHSASLRSQSGLGSFGNNLPPFLGR